MTILVIIVIIYITAVVIFVFYKVSSGKIDCRTAIVALRTILIMTVGNASRTVAVTAHISQTTITATTGSSSSGSCSFFAALIVPQQIIGTKG